MGGTPWELARHSSISQCEGSPDLGYSLRVVWTEFSERTCSRKRFCCHLGEIRDILISLFLSWFGFAEGRREGGSRAGVIEEILQAHKPSALFTLMPSDQQKYSLF